MSHLRPGDRVQSRSTGRIGTVTNITGSLGWEDQARVDWDDGDNPTDLLDWPTTNDLRRL